MTLELLADMLRRSPDCVLCQSPEIEGVAMFVPEGSTSITRYALCRKCRELGDWEQRVESAVSAQRSCLDLAAEKRAQADDQVWFTLRPYWRYRLRSRFPNERRGGEGNVVFVTQHRPGVRTRDLLSLTAPERCPTDQVSLARIAELLVADRAFAHREGRIVAVSELGPVARES